MTVLDAFAVLAFLKEEPAAAKVAELLRNEPRPALTALGVAEVLDHLVRLVGLDEEDVVLDLAQLGLAEAHAVDADLASRGGCGPVTTTAGSGPSAWPTAWPPRWLVGWGRRWPRRTHICSTRATPKASPTLRYQIPAVRRGRPRRDGPLRLTWRTERSVGGEPHESSEPWSSRTPRSDARWFGG